MAQNLRRSARFQNRHSIPNYADLKSFEECTIDNYDSYSTFENDKFKEELRNIEENDEKPTELFSKSDVDGKAMYPVINTSIKKNAMLEKAKMCGNIQDKQTSPIKKHLRICLTKIANDKLDQYCIKTNSNQTEKKTKEMKKISNQCGKNVDNETNSVIGGDKDFKNINIENEKKNVLSPNTEIQNHCLRALRSRVNKGYHLKSDEYFMIQSEKSITSNHTLSKLKNRHLDERELQQLLKNNITSVSKTHQKQIEIISRTLQMRYMEWLYLMKEGFSVLLFGLGSKRQLINDFRKQIISDESTLVINGFFPSLTIKDILDSIIIDLLGLSTVSNQSECFNIIEKALSTHHDDCIYLLIHNIDGGMLRSNKAQDVLSRLASIPNIYVLASVDHINAPLLWDNVKRARYNFYWMDVTTCLPYEAETSYENSLLVQKSGALALCSLENVFSSLTSNAKAIYVVLAKYQLEHNENNYAGMAFKDLYRVSREAFLVCSDQALRAQLTEFIDHKLVKIKRQIDGVEYLVIPLDDTLLKQFLEQQNEL